MRPPTASTPAVLAYERLRPLTIDPRRHPRHPQHLSAASGLVCCGGRVYVIADDEHHVAVFSDRASPGDLYRIVPGDLPTGRKARKRRKPDLETLMWLPAGLAPAGAALLALGSGSRPTRDTGVRVPLRADGLPSARVRRFDLRPLYDPLRARLGEINIEGAMRIGDTVLLLNRGVGDSATNAAVCYRLRDVLGVVDGAATEVRPVSIREYDLGRIDGIALGFTDAAVLPGGGWAFTAVAEDTRDSVADGACAGSVVGTVDARGRVASVRRLAGRTKVEGIDLHATLDGISICLVTDADDPAQSSWLLRARL